MGGSLRIAVANAATTGGCRREAVRQCGSAAASVLIAPIHAKRSNF